MDSERFIHESFEEKDRNESRKLLNEDNEYYDGNIRIIPFEIESRNEKITNYILIPNKLEGKVLKEKIKEFKVPNAQISKLLSEGFLLV